MQRMIQTINVVELIVIKGSEYWDKDIIQLNENFIQLDRNLIYKDYVDNLTYAFMNW
jgi:hypothetical protein